MAFILGRREDFIFTHPFLRLIVVGRNRDLEGLAVAMSKLWERSAIAKIAIKRGVHNTCNERMAEELKVRRFTKFFLCHSPFEITKMPFLVLGFRD